MGVRVVPLGAAETVTGSCHLLEVNGKRILIDCGLFQGEDEEKNYEPFGFDPKGIDYVIITHAHLDHIGRLPLLVKAGFGGKVISTKPTKYLARIMLLDAVKVMAEDYKTRLKKALRRGLAHTVKPPLYGEDEVYDAVDLFQILLPYGKTFEPFKGVRITLRNAGHILGSAFAEIEVDTPKGVKRFIFSGDLGWDERLLIPPLEYYDRGDYIFVETTYGNRRHKSLKETIEEFKNAIVETFERGGNVVIPTFALERAQEVLFVLRELYERGELPPCRVFLDSPLAIAATRLFTRFPQYLSGEVREMLSEGRDPFRFPYLKFTETVEESKKINAIESSAIILAGSGMCTGGRVLHHLKHNLWREESSVIFVGYQVRGTLGREIVDGAKRVKIYGEEVEVRAKIYTVNGFSSHADQPTLLRWLSNFKDRKGVFLIHGERPVMEVFGEKLRSTLGDKPHIPKRGEVLEF